jgi:hypothetical protein
MFLIVLKCYLELQKKLGIGFIAFGLFMQNIQKNFENRKE